MLGFCTGTQLTSAAPNDVRSSSAHYHSFATLMKIFLNVACYNGNYLFCITCFVAQKSSLFWGSLEPAFCMSILDRNIIICLMFLIITTFDVCFCISDCMTFKQGKRLCKNKLSGSYFTEHPVTSMMWYQEQLLCYLFISLFIQHLPEEPIGCCVR